MRVWKLNKDGTITVAGMHECYAQGQYRSIMPYWITDKPKPEDFKDWASRVPRASDDYSEGLRRPFDYGLYYKQVTWRGDGWRWGEEFKEMSIAPPTDSLISHRRERNRGNSVQHDEREECRDIPENHTGGDLSDVLEVQQGREKRG